MDNSNTKCVKKEEQEVVREKIESQNPASLLDSGLSCGWIGVRGLLATDSICFLVEVGHLCEHLSCACVLLLSSFGTLGIWSNQRQEVILMHVPRFGKKWSIP